MNKGVQTGPKHQSSLQHPADRRATRDPGIAPRFVGYRPILAVQRGSAEGPYTRLLRAISVEFASERFVALTLRVDKVDDPFPSSDMIIAPNTAIFRSHLHIK